MSGDGAAKTHQAIMEESDFGVPDPDSPDNGDWGDVPGNKLDVASTAATASQVALLRAIITAVGGGSTSHTELFTGSIYYVDAAQADDTGDGKCPDTAKKTVNAGIALMIAGDRLKIKYGTYDEDGMALTLGGLEFVAEAGAIFVNSTPGTVLTVSGAGCVVKGAHLVQAGAAGLVVTGIGVTVENCISVNCTIGFDIDQHSTQIFNSVAANCTVTQFDIGAKNTVLRDCLAPGGGGATRGFYLSASGVARCTLDNCHSVGNATAGFEMVAGTFNNSTPGCTSGGGDGATVDNGVDNNWATYEDQMATEQHEDIYPKSAGQGVAGDPVTVSNATTDGGGGQRDDQNYWGDITRIIPPDVLTIRWKSIGIYIHGTTANDIQQWETFFTYADTVSAQNGGNDWDENEVDLTVVDGSVFENGDHVWITGNDRVEGEIMLVSGAPAGNVVTLVRETTADGEAGLRYNYDATGVNNRMYVVKRTGSSLYHGFEGDFSANNARFFIRFQWHVAKQIAPDGGFLMRMLNASDDGASEFDVRAIYED